MFAPLRIAASAGVDIAKALGKLPGGGKKGKKRVKKAFNGVYTRCENEGLIPRMPDYLEDYGRDYPELLTVEAAHADIRRECERLLAFRSGITDMSKLGGQYTERGIHTIQWKAFMLKSGTFIEENCALAPKTAAVLRPLTNVYNAFFSIVEPHQYITPHWGYYKGFLRYHLGVIIPADNAEKKCWLRVNVDPADNAKKDKTLIERARKYHWRNGKGVMFDDTNLHDAANESDEVRVVLWLDVARKFPRTLDLYNRALLKAVYYEPSVRKFRENAVVHLPDAARA